MEKGYRNLGYVFLLLPLLVIGGFFKTYFGAYSHFSDRITPVIHFHAGVLSLWIISLIVQPLFILYGKNSAHQLIGKLSYILVPLIMVSFALVINSSFTRAYVEGLNTRQAIKKETLTIIGMILFAVYYILAIRNKRNSAYHMRYMIATGLVIIPPALIRLLIFVFHVPPLVSEFASLIFIDFLFIALIMYDSEKKQDYKPFLISLALFFIGNIFFTLSKI